MSDGYYLSVDSSNMPSLWALLPPEGRTGDATITRLDTQDEFNHMSDRERAITKALLQHSLDQLNKAT